MDSVITIMKTLSGKGLWVSGNTVNHKDKLKEMGGSWNSSRKSWVFSIQKQQILLDYFQLSSEQIIPEVEKKLEVKSVSANIPSANIPSTNIPSANIPSTNIPSANIPSSITIMKTKSGKGLWVLGDTKNIKNKLLEMGGKWNSTRKSWVFSIKKIKDLVDLFNIDEDKITQEE